MKLENEQNWAQFNEIGQPFHNIWFFFLKIWIIEKYKKRSTQK